jgi:hypothetical protein
MGITCGVAWLGSVRFRRARTGGRAGGWTVGRIAAIRRWRELPGTSIQSVGDRWYGEPSMSIPVSQLNHAVLFVRDAERAAEFYGRVFGFEVVGSEMGG